MTTPPEQQKNRIELADMLRHQEAGTFLILNFAVFIKVSYMFWERVSNRTAVTNLRLGGILEKIEGTESWSLH